MTKEVAIKQGESAVAVVKEKPLNQTQMKNLERLIEGDMRELAERLMDDIHRRREERLKELEAEYANDNSAEDANRRLTEAARKFEDQLTKMVSEFKSAGLKVTGGIPSINLTSNVRVENEELDKKKSQVDQSTNFLIQRANRIIQREQRRLSRAVLISGITTTNVESFTQQIPDLDDMLNAIATEIREDNRNEEHLALLEGSTNES